MEYRMVDELGVTVVVPTLNRGGVLYDCLQDLIAQEHRPLEILVVDQSAEVPEEVQRLVAAKPDIVSYHSVSFRGLPLARNYGLQHARYEAVVFVDDDTRCPPGLVGYHARALLIPHVGAVGGRVNERVKPENSPRRAGHFNYWTASPSRNFSHSGEYDVDHVPGGNFGTWRHVADAVGAFDEDLNVGAALYEETDYCLRVKRAGFRIYYNGQAQLDHLATSTGGCRVDTVVPYVWALAHNRTVVIRRHLRWFHKPTAFAELVRLGFAYAVNYRKIRVLRALLEGVVAALKRDLTVARRMRPAS